MDPKRAARQRVTELLRRFFEGLKGQLATGTTDLWQKVQQRVSPNPESSGNPRTSGPELMPLGTQMPMQQQPVQQQQSKTQDEKRDKKPNEKPDQK